MKKLFLWIEGLWLDYWPVLFSLAIFGIPFYIIIIAWDGPYIASYEECRLGPGVVEGISGLGEELRNTWCKEVYLTGVGYWILKIIIFLLVTLIFSVILGKIAEHFDNKP